MRVLVTGAAGFTGFRMMEFLAAQDGVTPVGVVRRRTPETKRIHGSFAAADLLARDSLHAAVMELCPDAIIHLAGLTHGTPDALHATNATGTKYLLDAALAGNPGCRILVVSSSAVYGYAGDLPIPETAPLRPVADYGRSKADQESVAFEYARDGAAVAVARPFNLAGPGQTDAFVCGRIVNQVIAIERKERDALDLREISSSRDLVDVRDVVRGYWALLSHPEFSGRCSGQAFNLGSGNAYGVSAIIGRIEEITGAQYPVRLPETTPPIAVPTQRSDNSRIMALTGWRPAIPLAETLRDMLDAARKNRK